MLGIILFFLILSVLAWAISSQHSTPRKQKMKDLVDSIKGGIGLGIIYAIIFVIVIILVRLVFTLSI